MKDSDSSNLQLALNTRATISEMKQSGWLGLPPDKKAYAIAYVEEGYSPLKVATSLGMPFSQAYKLERDPLVMALVQEIQEQMQGIDTLNQQWVDTKIKEIMPMVMGEVAVPMVDMKTGEQFEARKFMPEVAVRILELKSPRKELGTAKDRSGVNVQINFGALGIDQPPPVMVSPIFGDDSDGD